MCRAVKVRLYPAKDQINKRDFRFGAARWVFNNALELSPLLWEERRSGRLRHPVGRYGRSEREVSEPEAVSQGARGAEALPARSVAQEERVRQPGQGPGE
ncbi:helix-turn-helix domain-containing protein, partial [Roseibium sp. RKSG952]|uniref:helix-turn-helix domain-containing protein n=1 Tax=Roseibium sp. RKSG952 TaxID=2529384 RepID=UPI0018AD1E47